MAMHMATNLICNLRITAGEHLLFVEKYVEKWKTSFVKTVAGVRFPGIQAIAHHADGADLHLGVEMLQLFRRKEI